MEFFFSSPYKYSWVFFFFAYFKSVKSVKQTILRIICRGLDGSNRWIRFAFSNRISTASLQPPQERIRLNQVLDEMPLSSSASINLKYVYLDFSVEWTELGVQRFKAG